MPNYLEFFNLQCAPFSSTPDTRFYIESDSGESLFSQLIGALNTDNGFVRIIGEAGAGKTILCRKLLNALRCHKTRYKVIHIPNPKLSEEGLYLAIAQELNLKTTSRRSKLRRSIIENLSRHIIKKQRRTVIVIDEGQLMPDDTLEALSELLDHEVEGHKLLRVALFSMPLDKTLQELPAVRLLQDRITLEKELTPFNEEEVSRYVNARLVKAGSMGRTLFTDDAIKLIAKGSLGVPRVINLLAHKALMNAYNAKLQQVEGLQARLAIAATEFSASDTTEYRPHWLSRFRKKSA